MPGLSALDGVRWGPNAPCPQCEKWVPKVSLKAHINETCRTLNREPLVGKHRKEPRLGTTKLSSRDRVVNLTQLAGLGILSKQEVLERLTRV